MVSRVDLPDPEAPMMATSSPRSTVRSTPASATTAVGSDPVMHRDAIEAQQLLVAHRRPFVLAIAAGSAALATVPRMSVGACRRTAAESRCSEWSSQRISASAWKIIESTTSSQANSSGTQGRRLQTSCG